MMGFVDESIPILDKIPPDLKEAMLELEKAYKADDLVGIAAWEDLVDVNIRDYCLCGVLTEEECDAMMRRYGWYR